MVSRRRFLQVSAGLAGASIVPGLALAKSEVTSWSGVVLGAEAQIHLVHDDPDMARQIISETLKEIERLENLFSLYRPNSALSELNRSHYLEGPDFDMVKLLARCQSFHKTSGGLFDPSVQVMWSKMVETGCMVCPVESQDFSSVRISAEEIRLADGMALTLNGVAQGYVTDRVSAYLKARGLNDVLVNMGEYRAMGHAPGQTAWPVFLSSEGVVERKIELSDRALASSDAYGTMINEAAGIGHILHPQKGWTYPTVGTVHVSAPDATTADAVSTLLCLVEPTQRKSVCDRFPDVNLLT